jgi:DNA-binding CsgD family transcriptional regulator
VRTRSWQRAHAPAAVTPNAAGWLALAEAEHQRARGYTNREIADTLVISLRTADVHVSHILRKLGAPNRLEAAAIAHRLSPPSARVRAEGRTG